MTPVRSIALAWIAACVPGAIATTAWPSSGTLEAGIRKASTLPSVLPAIAIGTCATSVGASSGPFRLRTASPTAVMARRGVQLPRDEVAMVATGAQTGPEGPISKGQAGDADIGIIVVE